MVAIPWNVFNSASTLPPLIRGLTDIALRTMCGLYRDFPDFTIALASRVPKVGLPVAFLMPLVCPTDIAPPPAPPAPQSTGQCGTQYDVVVSYTRSERVNNVYQPPVTQQETIVALGRIRNLELRTDSAGTTAFLVLIRGRSGNPDGIDTTTVASWTPVTRFQLLESSILSITRRDGRADNCGSQPIQYPVAAPPVSRTNFNTTINIDNQVLNVPVAVVFNQFNATAQIDPTLSIDVGGLRFTFTMEGIDIAIAPTIPVSPAPIYPDIRVPADRPPVYVPPTPGGGGSTDLTPVLNAIANVDADLELVRDEVLLLQDCDRCNRPPIGDPRLAVTTLTSFNSGVINLPPNAVWLSVEQTQLPSNVSVQSGGSAPNVIFSGWYSFGSSIAGGDRHPIHYQSAVYPVPEGMTVCALTLYLGHSATIRIYSLEEQ